MHVTTSDSGSVGNTRVQVTNAQLGSYYVQSLDALGSTTFELLDNHVYTVTLIDYPETYYGGSNTVEITGGEIQNLTIEMNTEPDIIGWDYNTSTGEMVYTDGASNWTPASFDADHHIQYHSFADSWLLRGIHSCLYKDGVVQYYLDENDNTKKTDGTDADITSGADGDVMVEFQKIYTKFSHYTDTNNHYHWTLQISKQALSGYYPVGFYNKNNVIQDTTYIAKYLGYRDATNHKIRSLSGSSIATNWFSVFFEDSKSNFGNCLFHNEHLQLLCILFSMMFKTLKFEDIYPYCGYNSHQDNGHDNKSGLFNANSNGCPKIFGIENMGCAYECVAGDFVRTLIPILEEGMSYYQDKYISFAPNTDDVACNRSFNLCAVPSSTSLLSGNILYPYSEFASSRIPFEIDIPTGDPNINKKTIALTDSLQNIPTSSAGTTSLYFMALIGTTSTIKGLFKEDYTRPTFKTGASCGVFDVNVYGRLASIPV